MCHQDTKTIISCQSLRKRLASFPPVFSWGGPFFALSHSGNSSRIRNNFLQCKPSLRVSKEQAKRLATGNSELAAP